MSWWLLPSVFIGGCIWASLIGPALGRFILP